jgi:archaellum component FlaC
VNKWWANYRQELEEPVRKLENLLASGASSNVRTASHDDVMRLTEQVKAIEIDVEIVWESTNNNTQGLANTNENLENLDTKIEDVQGGVETFKINTITRLDRVEHEKSDTMKTKMRKGMKKLPGKHDE